MIFSPTDYLQNVVSELGRHWPENRVVNVVCHGHSVPAGYFATPFVDTFNAYPHLLHRALKARFPFATINVIVTAIGGENSEQGAARFFEEVLCHRADVLTLDYALNDRNLGLNGASAAWRKMIEEALARDIKIVLLTPTPDKNCAFDSTHSERHALENHAEQIRALSIEYSIGLVDSLAAFDKFQRSGGEVCDLLSWINHPNKRGHELIAELLLRLFAPFG